VNDSARRSKNAYKKEKIERGGEDSAREIQRDNARAETNFLGGNRAADEFRTLYSPQSKKRNDLSKEKKEGWRVESASETGAAATAMAFV